MLAGGPQQCILFFQALTIFIAECFLAPRVSAAELTIPCNAQHFTLISYNDYTIRDCTRSDGSPFLFLGTRPDASALIVVSITVLNGSAAVLQHSHSPRKRLRTNLRSTSRAVSSRYCCTNGDAKSIDHDGESFVAKNISMKNTQHHRPDQHEYSRLRQNLSDSWKLLAISPTCWTSGGAWTAC